LNNPTNMFGKSARFEDVKKENARTSFGSKNPKKHVKRKGLGQNSKSLKDSSQGDPKGGAIEAQNSA